MSDNNKLLSTEELDALSTDIASGAIAVNTGYNDQVSVRKHDLTNEDSSLGINVTSLDMINERFIRAFRVGLLEVLRTSPKISPSRVRLEKYGEYQSGLVAPLSVNVIRINPLRGPSLVLIDPKVIFTYLDSFFGGSGKSIGQLPSGRLFTQTEHRVISIILDVVFRSLKDAWLPLMPLEFEKVSAEINPRFAQIADENDIVVISHFEAECGDEKGFIDIVYPYSSLKPIRELLRNRVQPVDGDEESQKRWQTDLADAVGDAELELRVLLGQFKMNLSTIGTMEENDVLFFKKPEYAQVLVNDIRSLDAIVGTSGPSTAIQINKFL